MNIYIIITVGGLIGILLHSLKKVNEINKGFSNTTFKIVFVEFWKHDKLSLLTSAVCFGALLFISSEFVNLNQLESVDNTHSLKERLFNFKLAGFIKTASVIAGYFSDSLVYGFMGVTSKRIAEQFAKLTPPPSNN
jgi:hypothetical protein